MNRRSFISRIAQVFLVNVLVKLQAAPPMLYHSSYIVDDTEDILPPFPYGCSGGYSNIFVFDDGKSYPRDNGIIKVIPLDIS